MERSVTDMTTDMMIRPAQLSALAKIWEITRRLLYQNRWIYLLLMSGPLVWQRFCWCPHLNQRSRMCFLSFTRSACTVWGWWRSPGALCWVTSSVPAVSPRCFRGQSAGGSTFRLGLRGLVALGDYVVSFVVSGAALLAAINRPLPLLFALALAELLLGMWTAAAATSSPPGFL